MHRRALALVLLAVAAGAGAESPSLAVRAAGQGLIEAVNRQTLSLALTCESTEAVDRTFAIVPWLPEGWKAVGGTGEFALEAGVPDVRLVSFLVPAEAPAGEYLLRFELRDRADASVSTECGIRVVVLPVVAFEVTLLEAPAFVLAGDEYESAFLLSNSGNVDISIDLDVTCGQALPCRLVGLESGTTVPVPAGTRREFRVAVRTQSGISHSTRHPVRVLARLHGAETDAQAQPSTAISVVEMIPLSLGTGSLMHTIPMTFVTTAGMAFAPGFTGLLEESINASGTLDESGGHRLDLGIRKQLATGQDPLFAASDRYSIRYEQRLGEILFGDHAYSLSPLLVMNQYARGVGGTLALDPLRFSTILYRDVWSAEGSQGLGGSVDFTIPKAGSWDDVLYRVGLGALWPFTDHAILGLWQQYHPLAKLHLQLDAALDIGPGGLLNPAIIALGQGEILGVSWTARLLRAWPGFTGEISDTQSIAASAFTRLLDGNLALDAAFGLSETNLLLDPARPAERTIALSLGMACDMPVWDSETSLGYDLTRRRDRFPVPDFMSWEHRVQLAWKQRFQPFTASLASSITWSIDEVTSTLLSSQKHLLSLEYDPSTVAQYDVSLSWSRHRTDRLMPNDSAGINARAVLLFDNSKLEGAVGTTWAYGATGLSSVRFVLDAGFTRTFPWGHTLSIIGGAALMYEALAWSPTGSLSASYGIPVDLPVSRKKGVSVVRGTVVRLETGEPQEGIVLRLNGLASASDKNGEFIFYVPKTGNLYMQMDGRTLEPGVIPAQPMPFELTIAPSSESVVDLAVVAGCTVTGAVFVYGYPTGSAAFAGNEAGGDGSQLQRIGGLGSMIVELSNGIEKKRRVTGTDGRFVFEEVRPGDWTLAVVGGTLPSYHTLEPRSVALDLAPGQQREIEIKVIQERRRIIMLDTGLAVVTGGAAGPAGEITVTSGGGQAKPPQTAPAQPDATAPAPVVEPSPVEPAPAVVPAPVEPAPVEPAPVQPQPVPGETNRAPDQPPHETLVMAAQAGFNAPAMTWQQILAAMQTQPIPPSGPSATAAAAPAAPQTPAAATTAPVTAAPAAVAPKPPSTTPVTTSPAAPVAVPTVPAPTPPPIRIPIPLPMPTPKPPVTVPVPTPTPQPFWP